MTYQTIEVRKLTPHIGAEIRGVDLSSPLGNQQFQEVHDALMDRLVIFFHDQKLSIEQHKDFGRRFGKLHVHPASPDLVPDHPEVLVIKADDKAKYMRFKWARNSVAFWDNRCTQHHALPPDVEPAEMITATLRGSQGKIDPCRDTAEHDCAIYDAWGPFLNELRERNWALQPASCDVFRHG